MSIALRATDGAPPRDAAQPPRVHRATEAGTCPWCEQPIAVGDEVLGGFAEPVHRACGLEFDVQQVHEEMERMRRDMEVFRASLRAVEYHTY